MCQDFTNFDIQNFCLVEQHIITKKYFLGIFPILDFTQALTNQQTRSTLKIKAFRRSHPKSSVKKAVFENFLKFTGKHLCQNFFFNKVAGWGLQVD